MQRVLYNACDFDQLSCNAVWSLASCNFMSVLSIYYRLGGIIDYIVEGIRCYSSDLPQGGIEIPWKLFFEGTL